MGAVTLGGALFGAVLATSAHAAPPADNVARWQPLIAKAAARFELPVEWIARVIRAESGGLTMIDGRPIRSRVGAMGLMQLMPATWAAMRQAYGLGTNPDDPQDNIVAGSAFLRAMYDRFGYPGLFAAYNAGPARYAASLASGHRLPQETIAYLAKLSGPAGMPAPRVHNDSLFALRHDRAGSDPSQPPASGEHGLFAVESGTP
jgi:soluble lytic murein transglycosylase-like protein